MKALLIIVSLLTVTIALDAQYYLDQWYFKKCQVTNINNSTPEELECLWTKANSLRKTGTFLTVVATTAVVLPLLIAIANPYAVYSLLITVPASLGLYTIGIPCMFKGRNRINQLKIIPINNSQNVGAWYVNQCQVPDINNCTPEEFECLWTKAKRLENTGITLTVVGTTLATFAGVVLLTDPYSWTGAEWPQSYNWWLFGVIGVSTGVLLDLVGVPCLFIGRSRQNQLKNTPNFKSQSAVALNLNPTINRNHFNNKYSVGLTASLSF